MKKTQTEIVTELVEQLGVIRPRDLDRYRIPRIILTRLVRKGALTRLNTGVYVFADGRNTTEFQSLAEAGKLVPQGVICLLSALVYHGFTTQAPSEVWIAIDGKARQPRRGRSLLRFVRFSGSALHEGVENKRIQRVTVKVYSPAKTVVDCFKYRNKIGIDVALEALRECVRNKICTIDEIWRFAKMLRMANVMRPYMDGIE
jgi:predicted transcriptional regulator of viral defense system